MGLTINNNSIINPAQTSLDKLDSAGKLQSKLNEDLNNATDEALMDVCKSFEAYFIEQVYKEMKKTIPDNSLDNNPYTNYFGDMLYEEYAKSASETGDLGIAQMLYESMKRN